MKHLLCCLILSLSLCLQGQTPQELFQLGKQAIEQKQYEKSIDYYSKLIAIQPQHTSAIYNRSVAYYLSALEYKVKNTNDYDAQQLLLRKCNADVISFLGFCLQKDKNNQLIEPAYLRISGSYEKMQVYDSSIFYIDKIVERNPAYRIDTFLITNYKNRLHNRFAKYLIDKSDRENYFATVLEELIAQGKKYNDNTDSLRKELDAIVRKNDSMYHIAIDISRPVKAEEYRSRAGWLKFKGYYEEAIKNYTKSISLNANDKLAYEYRGETYEQLKLYHLAEPDYLKAKDLEEYDDFYIDAKIALLHANQSKYQLGLDMMTNYIKKDSLNHMAYFYRGLIHHKQFNNIAAKIDFQKALAIDKANPNPYARGIKHPAETQLEIMAGKVKKAAEIKSKPYVPGKYKIPLLHLATNIIAPVTPTSSEPVTSTTKSTKASTNTLKEAAYKAQAIPEPYQSQFNQMMHAANNAANPTQARIKGIQDLYKSLQAGGHPMEQFIMYYTHKLCELAEVDFYAAAYGNFEVSIYAKPTLPQAELFNKAYTSIEPKKLGDTLRRAVRILSRQEVDNYTRRQKGEAEVFKTIAQPGINWRGIAGVWPLRKEE